MSDLPSAGYITDVAYPAHFHRETLPSWLVSTATALGHVAPRLDAPYTWLDLGCGAGLGVLIAAAANPQGHFIGVDLSAREIDRARRTAAQAGLANVQFLYLDINDATAPMLPACDFIVSHGVYAWVDAATRTRINEIVQQHLKPGGLLYLGYMSQPGAAAFASARRLLQLTAQATPGDTTTRARAGMQMLQSLAQAGAGFFVEHPAAQREMLRADTMDDAYLVHELLNDEWHALHVADVMAGLDACGCHYVGSATLLDNIDALSIPGNVQPMLDGLRRQGASPAHQETLRDLARNQNLRRDIYQRQAADGQDHRLKPEAHRQALLAQHVGLLPAAPRPAPTSGQLVLDTRIGPVKVPMEHVGPLLDALTKGSRSYADIAALPAYRHNPGIVNQLLQALAWAGWVHYLPVSPAPALPPDRLAATQQALHDHGYGPWAIQADVGTAVPGQR